MPELKEHPDAKSNLIHLAAFLAGVGLLFAGQAAFAA
jgi:hypothetical protein